MRAVGPMRVLVAGFAALFLCIGHAAVFAADKEPPPLITGTPVVIPASTTSTTLPAPTTSVVRPQPAAPSTATMATTTTTTIPPWEPADECRRLTRSVSRGAMRWCSTVAHYLHLTGDWQPGDLTKLMRTMDCESSGNPLAFNRAGQVAGLFQHKLRYFPERARKAAAFFGFDNPDVWMPYDNIAVAVWLYKFGGGIRHWPNCGRR